MLSSNNLKYLTVLHDIRGFFLKKHFHIVNVQYLQVDTVLLSENILSYSMFNSAVIMYFYTYALASIAGFYI